MSTPPHDPNQPNQPAQPDQPGGPDGAGSSGSARPPAPPVPNPDPAGSGYPQPSGYDAPPPGTYSQGGYGAESYQSGQAQPPRNGLGTAALIVGILALLFGIFFFPLGFLLALVGIGLGIAGRKRAKRGEATNGGAALTGVILSVVGLLISIAAGFFVGYIFSETEDCLTQDLTQAEREQCVEDQLNN